MTRFLLPPARTRVNAPDEQQNRIGARVYDKVARFDHLMGAPMDWRGGTERRRRILLAPAETPEIGVGTRIHFDHSPANVPLTGIYVFEQMLRPARERAASIRFEVTPEEDVEALSYAGSGGSFGSRSYPPPWC